MDVNQTWLAILCVLCCAPSVAVWTRLRLREFRQAHGSPRVAPAQFVGSCLDGVMMGVGTGLSLALVVLLFALLISV